VDSARIYTNDGQLQNEFAIGWAIGAQISTSGEIWARYYDEAIVGAGIAFYQGRTEPAIEAQASGLGCFNRLGDLIYAYMPPPGFGHIFDCYALNVVQDVAWACYYADFPLVRVGPDKTPRAWSNDVAGASALALRDDQVLLFGGYEDLAKRCVLQSIDSNGKLTPLASFEAILPEDADPSAVIGRGSKLCVVANAIWYELSFDDIT